MIHWSIRTENPSWVLSTIEDEVTVGPKKRVFIRILQILLALTAAVPSIYAALAIKLSNSKDPPPPDNKPPAYVPDIVSVLAVFILIYLFVIHQCCCTRNKPPKHPLGAPGMTVLPMNGLGGKKPKKNAKGNEEDRSYSFPTF